MKTMTPWRITGRAAFLAALLSTGLAGAQAQSLDSLKGAASSALGGSSGGSSTGGLAGMAGMGGAGMGGMSAGTMGNAAGVLEYCFKNNYLSGDSVSAVKDGLMGKMGGTSAAQSDSGYMDGAKGLLKGGDGKTMDLSGSGLQKQVTQQACDFVLKQGKSLL
ncbi:DUF2501 domain-containing protein [Variovorax sp.]|uniref:DUF2501 domain-containing protein n=1 Tax=Variovorax sp. TaxID=1871043 RepID=UPI002D242B9B|nr:DUF2501 domain-containing protein [Variovorax sp.]HYP82091.1 DUF2501 domain-containing protein [Variovorax sp.]